MPDRNYAPSKKAQDDFLSWLSEYYNMNWSLLQLPDVLIKYSNKDNQYYQYWAQYIWTPAHPAEKPPSPKPTPAKSTPIFSKGKVVERPGELSPEQTQAWAEYWEGGGQLGVYEWVAAGEMTSADEKAARDFLDSLDVYQAYQIQKGEITQEQADAFYEDQQNKIFAQGKYEGKDPTPFFSLSSYDDITSYMGSLPEAEATYIQERKVAIATQESELPLNAKGTTQDQMLYGEQAIKKLEAQRDVTPDFMLKDTIQKQINQLQTGIEQLWESEKGQAREKTLAQEPQPDEFRETGTMAKGFSEKYGMSPEAAQQMGMKYAQHPEEFAGLTLEEKQNLAWVGVEMTSVGRAEPAKPFEPPSFKGMGATGPQAWKDWFSYRYPGISRQFRQQPEEARTGGTWSLFLEKERNRLREEYAKKSPYERGERPSVYQPKIRTVNF